MIWTTADVFELQRLERKGVRLTIRNCRIWASPAELVDLPEQAWIIERKPALLELIEARNEWTRLFSTTR